MSLEQAESKTYDEFMAGYRSRSRLAMVRPVVIIPAPKPKAKPVAPKPMDVLQTVMTLMPAVVVKIEKPTAHDLIHLVANAFGLKHSELISGRRYKRFVRARQCFFWLAKQHTKLSSPNLGRLAGGNDHSTVLSGIKRFEAIKGDFQTELAFIARRLTNEV